MHPGICAFPSQKFYDGNLKTARYFLRISFLLRFFKSSLRDEWPSYLHSLRQVTEVKLGRLRSNSG